MIADPNVSLIADNAREIASDTGELKRNWADGVYTINTARTQAATGWIGGRGIALADVAISATTRNASVAVQSLDDKPIAQARKILISLGARSVPSGNSLPFHSEPVTGELAIRAPKGLKLYARSGAGTERAIPAAYQDGVYQITLEPTLGTYWLELR